MTFRQILERIQEMDEVQLDQEVYFVESNDNEIRSIHDVDFAVYDIRNKVFNDGGELADGDLVVIAEGMPFFTD